MNNKKLAGFFLALLSSGKVFCAEEVLYKLKIYNNSDYPAYVNVVARNTYDDQSSYYGVSTGAKKDIESADGIVSTTQDAYATLDTAEIGKNGFNGGILAERIIKAGEEKFIVYNKAPRAIWVRFAENATTLPSKATFKVISFPFSEANSEIYLEGYNNANLAAETIKNQAYSVGFPLSVAFWNIEKLGELFPNVTVKGDVPTDANGAISAGDLAKITPLADQAWNVNKDRNDPIYKSSVLLMFDKNLNPDTRKK